MDIELNYKLKEIALNMMFGIFMVLIALSFFFLLVVVSVGIPTFLAYKDCQEFTKLVALPVQWKGSSCYIQRDGVWITKETYMLGLSKRP